MSYTDKFLTRRTITLLAAAALIAALLTSLLFTACSTSATNSTREHLSAAPADHALTIAAFPSESDDAEPLITSRIIPLSIEGDGIVKATRNGSVYENHGQHLLLIDDLREQVRLDLVYTGEARLDAIELGAIPSSIRHGNTIALNEPSKVSSISVRFVAGDQAPDAQFATETSEQQPSNSPTATPTNPKTTPAPNSSPTPSPANSATNTPSAPDDYPTLDPSGDDQPAPDFSAGEAPLPTYASVLSPDTDIPASATGYPWAIKSDFQNYAGRKQPVLDGSLDAASEYLYTGFINGQTHFELWVDHRISISDVISNMKAMHPGPIGVASVITSYSYLVDSQMTYGNGNSVLITYDLAWRDGIDPDFDTKIYNDVRKLNLGGLSDYDRAIGIYKLVANRLSYLSNANGGSIGYAGAYTSRKANCMGYATLYKYAAAKVGLEAKTVVGCAYPSMGRHMWNTVIIDGQERGFDVCWADGLGGSKAYRYLCVGYGPAMDSEHIPD